ncbi:MAG TPA: hypothetical protein VJB95_02940 [Candidatus Paceibacterota bacterium]
MQKNTKFIFDFDDVLFYTTRRLREHIYPFLESCGIPREKIDAYYTGVRGRRFSIKKLLQHFSIPDLYEDIMANSKAFVNTKLVKKVQKLGKENCYILSYGDKEFQLDKIKRSGIENFFSDIIIVKNDKKNEELEKLCARHAEETIVFIDDKIKHLENIDIKNCPNLKTILYTGQNIDTEIEKFILKDK